MYMYMFVITILFVIMLIAYFILYSVSSLSESMKRFFELSENSLKTRGVLYPSASPFQIMTANQSMMKAMEDWNNTPVSLEEHVGELLEAGINWLNLRSIIEDHFTRKFEIERQEAIYSQLLSTNMDVFHGRKTFEQGEESIKEVNRDYEVPGKKWWEKEKRKEEFLENIRASFDKAHHERTTRT